MITALITILAKAARISFWSIVLLAVIFIFPSLAHLAIWSSTDKPDSWHQAKWSSAGILPPNPAIEEAKIYVLSARTGGLKGAFSTHTWIVLKPVGHTGYDRYDVVGWGSPVRKNAYDADAYWYSNAPVINHQIEGDIAKAFIPLIEKAIDEYPWNKRGDYVTWPGPNSNTFVASILRQMDGLAAATPGTAVGRDFPLERNWFGRHKNGSLYITLGGYAGLVIGGDTGFELNFLGLVAGVNTQTREILIPSFGGIKF